MAARPEHIAEALNAAAGRGATFALHAKNGGGYIITADISERDLLAARESAAEFRGIIGGITDAIVAIVAAAFFAEHKAAIFAAMSPEAIANLAVADAARHLRESVIDPQAKK